MNTNHRTNASTTTWKLWFLSTKDNNICKTSIVFYSSIILLLKKLKKNSRTKFDVILMWNHFKTNNYFWDDTTYQNISKSQGIETVLVNQRVIS